MEKYEFGPKEAYHRIESHWKQWAESVGATKWVVGISGGKDSAVVAALAVKIFGKENVYGVMMPNGVQKDIYDSIELCEHLGIRFGGINIQPAYESLINQVRLVLDRVSYDTETNLPARLRMSTLYAVAQTIGGIVLNTCNASEDCIGYSTIFGDNAGSYAPIQGLTVTEIRQLGDWLKLPYPLVYKTPIDGLQPLPDEEKLGFTYEALDRYIREDIGSEEFKTRINELYRKNKFKTDIVRIPGPNFDDLGNFVRYNNLPDAESPTKEEPPMDTIRIDAEPRYPEDAEVNDEQEDNDNPKMPFLVRQEECQCGWCWKLDIDIATGEIIGWPKEIKARVWYKVCDCCRIFYDNKEYYDYVPDFLAIDDNGWGDYIKLTIENGKIKNWSEQDCRKFIEWLELNG